MGKNSAKLAVSYRKFQIMKLPKPCILRTETISFNRQLKKNFENLMAPFYGWVSATPKLQSHYEEGVYFLPLSSQKFLVLI